MELKTTQVTTVEDYLSCTKRDTASWEFNDSKLACPWFRGQDRTDSPTPRLFRGSGYREFEMTRMFRDRSSALGNVPETDRIDRWLFLMQHYGSPTRLLDWTESPLIALFFALDSYRKRPQVEKYQSRPAVWALHPLILNNVAGVDGFPNTWTRKDRKTEVPGGLKNVNMNPGVEYFRLAFHPEAEWPAEINLDIVKLAIAVQASYVDLRMYSQKSCFTIHGTGRNDVESIYLGNDYLRQAYLYKYIIEMNSVDNMHDDLQRLGITKALVFPDFEGLSAELEYRLRAQHS